MTAATGIVRHSKVFDKVAEGRTLNEVKYLMAYTAATADNGDDFVIDLADFGGSTFMGAMAVRHTTSNSVVVVEEITTTVSGTEVTITIGGSTANKLRAVKLFYR